MRKLTLREQAIMELDRVVAWLETGAVDSMRAFGTGDERDWMLRMCAALLALLHEHTVDEHGRCTRCREPRRVLPGGRRASSCAVLDHVIAAFGDSVEAVWSRVLASLGADMTEDEVRDWLISTVKPVEEPLPLFNVDVIGGYGFGAAEFNLEQLGEQPGPPPEQERTDPISGWFHRPYLYDDDLTEPGSVLRAVSQYRQQAKVWRTPEELAIAGESDTAILPRLEFAETVPMYLPSFGPTIRA